MTSYVKLNPDDMNEEGLGVTNDITSPELVVEKSDEPIHSYQVEVYLYLYLYSYSNSCLYMYISIYMSVNTHFYVYIHAHVYRL
jgi:hypothetical protein